MRIKRWPKVFAAIAFLVIAQVVWWTTVFMRDVDIMFDLRQKNLQLQGERSDFVDQMVAIEAEAWHRRVMFLSESVSFMLLTCFGLYLLYSSLKAQERSQQSERNFIDVISHESRTPLTVLKLQLESLLERAEDSLKEDLRGALEEVRRLIALYEKAMNLNRVERATFHEEVLSLRELLEEAVRSVRHRFTGEAPASVEITDAAGLAVRGDSELLRNAFRCLLENATLYNPGPDKRIWVRIHPKDSKVSVEVADNGPSVSSSDRSRIFERYFRGSGSKNVAGTGLGLYLAKTIIEAHRGSLLLKPSSGLGNVFEVQLPRVADSGGLA